MSKLYYRLNSLCMFLKQEKLINDYDISHLKLYINEKKLEHDYNLLRLKFENDNKIFEIYKDFFLLLDETIDKNFTDKYKIFIDFYFYKLPKSSPISFINCFFSSSFSFLLILFFKFPISLHYLYCSFSAFFS